jgi:hypothetical protein
MNNITIDIDDMINNIFTNEPQDMKSIQLSFDVNDEYELFTILVDILTHGLKILFGDENDKVNINTITENDFKTIEKYFNSFGFDIKYKYDIPLDKLNINENTELPSLNDSKTENMGDGENQLRLYYFTLKTYNIKYEISFDYL